jgi:ribosomal protein L44E
MITIKDVNIMINDFCPKCKALTNMSLTTTESVEKDKEGKISKVITTSYNCNMCNTFVKSEDKKITLNSEQA